MTLRKKERRGLLLVGLLAWGGSCAGPQASQAAAPVLPDEDGWIVSVGQRIPALELVDETGKVRSLDEYLGQPVVLLFWGST